MTKDDKLGPGYTPHAENPAPTRRRSAKNRPSKTRRKPPDAEFPWIAQDLRPLAEPVHALELDSQNARRHDDANVKAIRASLEHFGQRKPIVVNRANNQVEAGNGTLCAARELGWTHLAVVWVEDDPAAQTGFSIADNRTAELATWDDELLAALLDQHADTGRALYDDLHMAELFDDAGKPAAGKTKETSEPKSPWPTCTYSVVVDCLDETDQTDLSARMEAEGRHCRLLTSVSTAKTNHGGHGGHGEKA